jgi:hypothetical protein
LQLKTIFTKIVVTLSLACVFSLYPAKLLASGITWTIANNTFLAGGASLEGSFQYDAGANTFTNVDVTVSDDDNPFFYSGTVPGDTYTTSDIVSGSSASELELNDAAAGTGLNLFFGYWTPDLTGAGGTVSMGVNLLVDGYGVADVEGPGTIPYNTSATGTAPEPQTAFLMLAGVLAVLGAKKWSSRLI